MSPGKYSVSIKKLGASSNLKIFLKTHCCFLPNKCSRVTQIYSSLKNRRTVAYTHTCIEKQKEQRKIPICDGIMLIKPPFLLHCNRLKIDIRIMMDLYNPLDTKCRRPKTNQINSLASVRIDYAVGPTHKITFFSPELNRKLCWPLLHSSEQVGHGVGHSYYIFNGNKNIFQISVAE